MVSRQKLASGLHVFPELRLWAIWVPELELPLVTGKSNAEVVPFLAVGESRNQYAGGPAPTGPYFDGIGTSKRILFATYFGGSGDDTVSKMALDGAGNIYITGITSGGSFPATPGAALTSWSNS
jgi:hypothetical protein